MFGNLSSASRTRLDDSEKSFEKVLWSDETNIELFGINSTCHVWRKKKLARTLKNTIPTIKHCGENSALVLFLC